MNFRIGNNIGQILLGISQENLAKGNIGKAYETYKMSLPGFSDDFVMKVLKNEMCIIPDETHTSVVLTDNEEELKKNESNIYDWNCIINSKANDLSDIVRSTYDCIYSMCKKYNVDPNNIDIIKYEDRGYAGHKAHLLAKAINNAIKKCGDINDKSWDMLIERVEMQDNEDDVDVVFYNIWCYVTNIVNIYHDFTTLSKVYKFLMKHDMCERRPFIEHTFECSCDILYKFASLCDYHHPMCNGLVNSLKEDITNRLEENEYGIEFIKYGMISKDIMDGYDAGWLSPDGKYYGQNGEVNELIHLNLAERLVKRMQKNGLIEKKAMFEDEEYILMNLGFMKIHGNECYGYYKWRKDDDTNERKLYCPTNVQIKMICDYADKYHNHEIYTEAASFGSRYTHKMPYKTSSLRQMNEIMLHKTFRL